MFAIIASPFRVILATAFFFSMTVLIYAPVIIPMIYLLDWLYTSGYIPWDQWRILYTVLFVYVGSIFLQVVFDNLFGLTYREIIQDPDIEEASPDHPHLGWLHQVFEQVKKQFPGEASARIFYNPTHDINAIAFRDLRHKGVMIYGGLVNAILDKNTSAFSALAIKGILAHEMSHLANWDFLSGQYCRALNRQYLLHARIRNKIFEVLWAFLPVILIVGHLIRWAMAIVHNLTTALIQLLSSIYTRLDAAVSRSIEFRCDRQAAKAVGWQAIFLGLSSLPIGSRSNVFDSHPDGVSRLLYVHRRGSASAKLQRVYGSFLARLTALLLFPLLFFMAWWLGEMADALPAGYFLPTLDLLISYLNAIPGMTMAWSYLISIWHIFVGSLAVLLEWVVQESLGLLPWLQSLLSASWHFAIHFHHNLLGQIEQIYQYFFRLVNGWLDWKLSLESWLLSWLPFTSTLLAELALLRLMMAAWRASKGFWVWVNQKLFLVRFTLVTRLFRKKSAPELDHLLLTAFNERNYSAVIRLIRGGAHPARVKLTSGYNLVQHLARHGDPLATSIARLLPKNT